MISTKGKVALILLGVMGAGGAILVMTTKPAHAAEKDQASPAPDDAAGTDITVVSPDGSKTTVPHEEVASTTENEPSDTGVSSGEDTSASPSGNTANSGSSSGSSSEATNYPAETASGTPIADVPPGVAETSPALDPDGTVSLAKLLLDAESRGGWKAALQPEIKLWQGHVGLAVDGKFGPASAYRMAEEVGVLPYIRYWPLGTTWGSGNKQFAVNKYKTELRALAAKLEAQSSIKKPLADALRKSADRENGQGWPDKPAAQTNSPSEVQGIVDEVARYAASNPEANS